jgi:cyanophycinase
MMENASDGGDVMTWLSKRALLAVVVFVVAAPAWCEDLSGVKGALLFGGGELRYDNTAIWHRFMELAGGDGASVVIVPAASRRPEHSAQANLEHFRSLGAKADMVPIAPLWKGIDYKAAAADPINVEKLRHAKGIWFVGGDQGRITRAMLGPNGTKTPALAAIWEAYRNGAVVGGSSAGTAIMSRLMFVNPRSPLSSLKYGLGKDGIGPGLGFVGDDWFVDQHFLVRGRFGRALQAMQAGGYKYGIGVDEDTAVVLQGGKLQVLGYKGALVMDISGSKIDSGLPEFNMAGVKLTYLDSGDAIDVKTREITLSERKRSGQKIDPNAKDFEPYYDGKEPTTFPDMLSAWAIYSAMYHVLDSKVGVAQGVAMDPWDTGEKKDLGFEFKLYRTKDTHGWATSKNGASSYTVCNISLDIAPVRLAVPLYRPLR